MADDVSDIASYYNSHSDAEDSRLNTHQLEYDLTSHFLDRYLPKQGSILEVGAATGRYTVELAKRGYSVTAVDLSAVELEECKKRVLHAGLGGQVDFIVADARDLSPVARKLFDAVLLMGPLYHLVLEGDRKTALKEANDHLREGSPIFSTFLSRYGVIADMLKNAPGWIEKGAEVQWLIEKGKRPDNAPQGGFRGYFATAPEIAPLHEAVGFETLTVVGVDPVIAAGDESYNPLQGEQREKWLDLFYKVSAEPSIIGASRHILYIGKKNKKKT